MPDEEKSRYPYKAPVEIPLSKGVLEVNTELCSGCMQCMHTCALHSFGVGSHELSNMRMMAYDKYSWDAYAAPCLQCTDPQCMRYCPVGAIQIDEKTGARVVNKELCIGCKNCIKHCPFTPARIVFDKEAKKASKCDLCGGDPLCVKACPTGALRYVQKPEGVNSGYTGTKGVEENG